MRPCPDVNLVSHNGNRRPCLGISEDFEISTGGATEYHQLILGQPFLLQSVECTLHSEDGRKTAESTCRY